MVGLMYTAPFLKRTEVKGSFSLELSWMGAKRLESGRNSVERQLQAVNAAASAETNSHRAKKIFF